MKTLDAWITHKLGLLDTRYQKLKTNLTNFFKHHSVPQAQAKRNLPDSSRHRQDSNKQLKRRSTRQARNISKKTPAHHQSKSSSSVKAQALLDLEVPQHQIAKSHLTAKDYKEFKLVRVQRIPFGCQP